MRFESDGSAEAAAVALKSNPLVEFVEPNYLIKADETTPDDQQFAEQWALRNSGHAGGQNGSDIGAARAWDVTTGSEKTIVAVIDSGIDFSHPDLKANQWTNQAEQQHNKDDDQNGLIDDLHGWDWVAGSNRSRDELGHGTAVAGIIAAEGNNKIGISGVMWRAGLMDLRVLDGTGTGDVAQAVEAIDYAVAHGAHVINCSWGTEHSSRALAEAVERAANRGVIVVAAAGNSGSNIDATPHYPASYDLPNVISVASTDRFDQLASWSNWGATRTMISAPGIDILSTQAGGGYQKVSGTSASAAVVTGVVGLVKTLRPRLKVELLRSMIIKGSRPVTALNGKVATGGVIHAAGAVGSLEALPPDEGKEEAADNAPGESNQNNNRLNPGNGPGADAAHSGRRVTPLHPVEDLPNLDQLRRGKSHAARAPRPIPSQMRRHRHNDRQNDKKVHGDTGTTTPESAAAASGNEGEFLPAKYTGQPREILIAAHHPQPEQNQFRLPLFDYLQGNSSLSTSDASSGRGWSYSATEHKDGLAPAVSLPQDKSLDSLIATLGRYSYPLPGVNYQLPEDEISPLGNGAVFISQTVAAEMIAGQRYTVTVKMQNTGSTTWTAGEGYWLGSRHVENNYTWNLNRVALPGPIAPNQEVSFTFLVTAPTTPDPYFFQWRMLRENVEWFGHFTPDTVVNVNSNAAFVSQSVPKVMQAGQTYAVSVTMTNTGPATWTSEKFYKLGSRNPQDNSIWGVDSGRTLLPGAVGPNQPVTFNFNVTAPTTPGVYNFQRQMVKDGLGWFGAMTPNVAVNVTADGTFTPTPTGNVLISEFRFRGAGGAFDEFVELYNNTNAPITVGTEDGSAGWALVALTTLVGTCRSGTIPNCPVTIFTVPAGTLIPARGHFLATGQSYSLSGHAEADFAFTNILDNTGIALFRTADSANFTLANRLDAVGFNSLTNTLYFEGTGLTPISTENGQYSFYRKLGSGTPQDTNSNAADFMLVSTTGGAYGRTGVAGDLVNGPSVLGAPGPENLTSPVLRNSTIGTSVIDLQQASSSSPNRVFGSIPNPFGTGTLSTMTLRRRFTNNTGYPVTRLRFRLVDMTTLNSQVFYTSQADLRAMSSSAVQVTLTNGSVIPVQGTTLEEPPTQASGGGLNTTMKAGTITTGTPLAPGATVDLQFQLGLVRGGSYRFLFNIEALPQSTTGGTAPPSAQDFAVAGLDPANRTGEAGVDLRSGNYNWGLPLVSLPGRAGLDLGLALVYNSRVWTKTGSSIMFDTDHGSPSPGFRLGFPVIQPRYYNAQAQKNAYLMVTPAGARVELRQTTIPNVYETADSSYLQLAESGAGLILRPTDGSQMTFMWQNGEYQCVEIKDRNGNYITVTYDALGQLQTVRDTLAREINFVYDFNQNLSKITQVRNGVEHVWASFGWGTQTIQTNFAELSVVGLENGSTIPVLKQVGLEDGSLYRFDYTTWGQVNRITRYTLTSDTPPPTPVFPADYRVRAYTHYFMRFDNGPQSDCARVEWRSDWAEHWNEGVESVTSYTYDSKGAWGQAITPDGTRYVEDYGAGWQKGLTVGTKIYEPGGAPTPVKSTSAVWTQDDVNLPYELNPRVTATDIDDKDGNHRHTEISYTSYGLPSEVREYQGPTVIRRAQTTYNLNAPYIDPANNRRLIGLVTEQVRWGVDLVDNAPSGGEKLSSKVSFEYDAVGEYLVDQGAATQHDAAYHANFNVRGNVTTVRRWDVSQNVSVASSMGYNTNGSAIFSRDPLWTAGSNRQVSISYADAFVEQSNPANAYNPFALGAPTAFAYPTSVTDADGYKAFSKYDYHLGAVRQVQSPPANTISTTDYSGPVRTTAYDAAGRATRVTNSVNAAQTVLVYPASLTTVQTRTKFKAEQVTEDQFTRSFQIFDGAGRVRAASSDMDPARPLYSGRKMVYDKLGRVVNQSNPTAITGSWVPTDDDATAGWVYSAQGYDWQGRPTLSVNADGTTKEAQYGGCGCAGGAVVLTRDEVGRRQKIISDILGRAWKSQVLSIQPKTEGLNGGTDADVYRTTTNTYNARDQITEVKEQAGVSGAAQLTTMSHDGYGRVSTRKAPIQTSATRYEYNSDDTLKSVIDARGATRTMIYNNRRLVTDVSYGAPSGITATGPATFAYDAAGNRTGMTDGSGRVDYAYDTRSRMTFETRVINGLPGSYNISYSYTLADQLKSLTDPDGRTTNYNYDTAGRLDSVTGAGYSVSVFASNIKYRASGKLKRLDSGYGLNTSQEFSYDSREQLTRYELFERAGGQPRINGKLIAYNYVYYPDGRIKFAEDERTYTPDPNWEPAETYHHFDRSYTYDHAGRLTEALTGAEARGGTVTDGPYKETYQYDVWEHMVNRTNRIWSRPALDYFSANYVNDRNQTFPWQYDAEGHVTRDDNGANTYDAAGGKVSLTTWLFFHPFGSSGPRPSWNLANAQVTYDGDGKLVKEEDTSGSYHRNLYYVPSTVLGGQHVLFVSSQWDDQLPSAVTTIRKVSVYANGTKIADSTAGNVTFEYTDAVTGRRIWGGGEEVEVDPLGQEVGTYDPGSEDAGDVGQYPEPHEFGNADDPSLGCTLDGISVACGDAMRLLNTGTVGLAREHNTQAVADPDHPGQNRLAFGQPLFGDHFSGRYWVDDWKALDRKHPEDELKVYTDIANGHWELFSIRFSQGRSGRSRPASPQNSKVLFNFKTLNDCTESLFGVTITSYTPSNKGQNGSFTGYGPDQINNGGNNASITVTNDVNSFSSNQLRAISDAGDKALGYPPRNPNRYVYGATYTHSPYNPYTNYTANNEKSTLEIVKTQIHELGNSLREITGAANNDDAKVPDPDAGNRLENCVFKTRR